MMKRLAALLVLGTAVAGVASAEAPAENPTAKLYAQKCASCHGKDGKGAPAMAKMFKVDIALLDLVDEATLKKKDEELDALTAKGINKMPAYADKMKAEEISALTKYFRSLAPAKPKG